MIFECHSCGYKTQVGDQYAGKNVKCPKCKTVVNLSPRESQKQEEEKNSIDVFISKTIVRGEGKELFELEAPSLLQINVKGTAWTKMGSMVAYTGNIKFTREGLMEHGLGKFMKKAVTGEGAQLTKAEGEGSLYLADRGKKISLLNLDGDAIFVNGNDLLAFQDGIQWDIKMMKKITGMLSGGLFNVRLEGSGMVAITTHHDPFTFKVTPGQPIFSDPNATVAWSGNLSPELKTDISIKTFLGRGSGESIQMKFDGDGFIVIQPFEEVYFQAG